MNIYVLNLDRSPERLAAMHEQLSSLGLDYNRLPAIDGYALDPNTISRHRLSPGYVGNFLSHRRAWGEIVASGESFGVVLEDDAKIHPGFRDVVANPSGIPVACDLIKIEESLPVRLGGEIISIGSGRILRRLFFGSAGIGGYIIARNMAGMLLALTCDFTKPPDMTIYGDEAFLSEHTVFHMIPAPIRQNRERFESTIATQDAPRRRRPSTPTKILGEMVRPIGQLYNCWRYRHFERVPFG